MSTLADHINELKAAEAFTRQSVIFDQLYAGDSIIEYKRQRVREHILKNAQPGCHMLELNCGTGEDALYFAQHGFNIHATDISTGMLDVFKKKLDNLNQTGNITIEECSFTDLDHLSTKKQFDYIYSNFGGLNCTGELDKVLQSLNERVKKDGVITLVIVSKFCLWELLLMFKGKFKTAFRRFFSGNGRKAHVEGVYFKCWYYSPSFVKKNLAAHFELIGTEALCAIVPPSYFENFALKHPKLYNIFKKQENRLKNKWPWKYMGDYFIVSYRKTN
jgi:ubiquinone/menaquinone biosynthesis C-methylase UbiE